MEGTTRDAICEKIRILLDQSDARYFDSDSENLTAHVDIANRQPERRPHVWGPVGVLITKRQELIFWELYYDKYLFLQDPEGRMCALSPKER